MTLSKKTGSISLIYRFAVSHIIASDPDSPPDGGGR